MKILNIRILKIQPLLNLVRGCIRAQALNGLVSSKFGGTLASLHGKSLHTSSPKGSIDLTVSANNSSSLEFNQQERLEKLVQDENYKY